MNGFDEVFNVFDEVFGNPNRTVFAQRTRRTLGPDGKYRTETITNDNGKITRSINNRVDARIASNDNYPPMDLYTKKGELTAEYAVAGINEDYLSIDYKDLKVYIKYEPSEEDPVDENKKYICRGIKNRPWETSFAIDPRHFDPKKIGYELKNGILKVTVGANEDWVEPTSIKAAIKPTIEDKTSKEESKDSE